MSDSVPDFLSSGGEMGKLVGSHDWSQSPLGPIATWPASLRSSVSLCLSSGFPLSLAWGPERVHIYNQSYSSICGFVHPKSIGPDFKHCWSAAWSEIGDAFA